MSAGTDDSVGIISSTNNPKECDQSDDTKGIVTAVAAADTPSDTRTRIVAEGRAQACTRWTKEGRRTEADQFRETVRLECRAKGMSRGEAQEHAWAATMAAFPPLGQQPIAVAPKPDPPAPAPEIATSNRITGLGDLPGDWPPLPDNAQLQAELSWVQSNRLLIVEERPNGSTIVRLHLATSPAPSRAALGWLETSIRSYAKYIDVCARCLAGEGDHAEEHRRERATLDEIRNLLVQLVERSDTSSRVSTQ